MLYQPVTHLILLDPSKVQPPSIMDYVPDVTAPNLSTLTKSDLITYATCPTVPNATSSIIPPKIVGPKRTKVLLTPFKVQFQL